MVTLAVHGVSNRNLASFEGIVGGLQQLGGPGMPRLQPVFWGDLGPPGEVLDSVPGDADTAVLLAPESAFETAQVVDGATQAKIDELTGATIAALVERSGAQVPEETAATIRLSIEEAAAEGNTLALQAELAPALAAVVLAAPPSGSPVIDEAAAGADAAFGSSAFRAVADGMKSVVSAFNGQAAALLVRLFREKEVGLSATVATTLGDILRYDRDGNRIRGRLDQAFREATADGSEVDVIAHSLGALVTVEWLLGAPVDAPDGGATDPDKRRVRTLVTFGAQVAMFAELQGLLGPGDPVGTLRPLAVRPDALPIAVGQWFNVWQELDPLAFAMGRVLKVDNGSGPIPVQDLRLEQQSVPTSLSFHSSYWHDQRFGRWLASTLAA